jgi:ABC-2 type transport system permease protein
MRRLLRVELARLRWRRAVHWLVLLSVVAVALLAALAAWNTRPPSAAEQQRVERLVAQEADQPYVRQSLRRCIRRPGSFGLDRSDDPAVVRAACEDTVLPRAEWFGDRPELDLREQTRSTGFAVAVVLTGVALLVGTTFAGHDWSTGSVTNQLLAEPRRLRLWLAKGVAVALAVLVAGAVLVSAFWVGLVLVAVTRGLDVGPVERDATLSHGWRATLLIAGAALGGYLLTMLLRSTVATLGVVIVAAAVLPIVAVLLSGADEALAWTPPGNAVAFLADGYSFYDDRGRREVLTAGDGATYLLLLLGAVGLASASAFRRGDVG